MFTKMCYVVIITDLINLIFTQFEMILQSIWGEHIENFEFLLQIEKDKKKTNRFY